MLITPDIFSVFLRFLRLINKSGYWRVRPYYRDLLLSFPKPEVV